VAACHIVYLLRVLDCGCASCTVLRDTVKCKITALCVDCLTMLC